MKLTGDSSPRLSPASQSVVKPFFGWMALLLILLSFLGGGVCSPARAEEDPVATIRDFSQQPGLTAEAYAKEVETLVKAFPDKAEDIIAEAVKDKPVYACDVVKAGIHALPLISGNPDPNLVASIVMAVLRSVQSTDPNFIDNIRDCAVEADKDALPQINRTVTSFLANASKEGSEHSEQGNPVHGNPSPTPHPTPKQVTPFQND